MMSVPVPVGRASPTAPQTASCVIRSDTVSWRRRPGAWHRLSASQAAFSGGDVALEVEHAPRSRWRSAAQRQCTCQAAREQMQVAITGACSMVFSLVRTALPETFQAVCAAERILPGHAGSAAHHGVLHGYEYVTSASMHQLPAVLRAPIRLSIAIVCWACPKTISLQPHMVSLPMSLPMRCRSYRASRQPPGGQAGVAGSQRAGAHAGCRPGPRQVAVWQTGVLRPVRLAEGPQRSDGGRKPCRCGKGGRSDSTIAVS